MVLQALEGSGWLNGWGIAAFEGGAMAFGEAFHSHKPYLQRTFCGSWLPGMLVARFLKTLD